MSANDASGYRRFCAYHTIITYFYKCLIQIKYRQTICGNI